MTVEKTQNMFQDSGSWGMTYLVSFHDLLCLYLAATLAVILLALSAASLNSHSDYNTMDSSVVEIVWTLGPIGTIVLMVLPSLSALYETDSAFGSLFSASILISGRQWIWAYSYETCGGGGFCLESPYYSSLPEGGVRGLEVDGRLVAPRGVPVRMTISSEDVIHSWTLPALGLKMDGVPGRLNQMETLIIKPGVFYGKCSEICGSGHSFMPISMAVVSPLDFGHYLALQSPYFV